MYYITVSAREIRLGLTRLGGFNALGLLSTMSALTHLVWHTLSEEFALVTAAETVDRLPTLLFLLVPGLNAIFWWLARTYLNREVMVASNTMHVMRAMLSAGGASGPTLKHSRRREPTKQDFDLQELQRQLPWLPGYDRRDCLIVKRVLDSVTEQMGLGAQVDHHNHDAFAVASHLNALANPSPGDAVEGATLRFCMCSST